MLRSKGARAGAGLRWPSGPREGFGSHCPVSWEQGSGVIQLILPKAPRLLWSQISMLYQPLKTTPVSRLTLL